MERARRRLTLHRGLLLSLVLAALLAAVPLPRLSAAAHDPARSGAGMGTRVPLLLETGARLGAPGAAAGLLRLPVLAGGGPPMSPPKERIAQASGADGASSATQVRLVSLGRLQLEGG